MINKILITYSTCTDSTKAVAESIGKALTDIGENADVLPMRDIAWSLERAGSS